jgi:phage-related protein
MHDNSRKLRPLKPVFWLGSSKADLIDFPDEARREAGYQLEKVQHGEEPSDWKPFPEVGPSVKEIRIHEASGAFRVMYLATRPEGVYVLHCFQKKTQQTSKHDVVLAQKRFKALPRRKK